MRKNCYGDFGEAERNADEILQIFYKGTHDDVSKQIRHTGATWNGSGKIKQRVNLILFNHDKQIEFYIFRIKQCFG